MTEDEKVKNLLRPRIKVVSPFPGMLKYGLNIDDILLGEDGVWENLNTKRDVSLWPFTWKDFPAIFKELSWYEERKESEMPQYLKSMGSPDKPSYSKIIKWDMDFMIGYITETKVCNLRIWKPEFNYYPCTEQEYINQHKVNQ